MGWSHGLIALARKEDSPPEAAIMGDAGGGLVVVHYCAYEGPPTESDRNALIEELATDPEFQLTDFDGEVFLVDAPPEVVEQMNTAIDAEEMK